MTSYQTRRGVVVVKRRWWLPHIPNLEDVSKYPYNEHERGDFHVYDVVEETHKNPKPDMSVILTGYLEGFGDTGDTVVVTCHDARHYLLPAQLAVYDTEENRAKIRNLKQQLKIDDSVERTPFSAVTARELEERLTLPVIMSPHKPWTLEKFHIRVALRKVGVVVESEDCIALPEDPVTSPCEIYFRLTVNGLDTVKVKAAVAHWSIDLDGNVMREPIEIWCKPKKAPKFWDIKTAEPVKNI